MQAQRKRRVMTNISKEKACREIAVTVVVWGRCEVVSRGLDGDRGVYNSQRRGRREYNIQWRGVITCSARTAVVECTWGLSLFHYSAEEGVNK